MKSSTSRRPMVSSLAPIRVAFKKTIAGLFPARDPSEADVNMSLYMGSIDFNYTLICLEAAIIREFDNDELS